MSADQGATTGTAAEVARWCQEYLADLLTMSPDEIDPSVDFDRLSIDSSLAVSLLGELEERYGVDLPPEALFANPTIDAVAALVAEQTQSPA